MGYWITHNIRATGSKADVDAYVSKLTQRRPKEINDERDVVWSEEEFSFYNIISPPEDMLISGEWWGQPGRDWRTANWECYDAPSEQLDTWSNVVNNTVTSQIQLSTKYDWPIDIFHELIKQYPNLEFNIWSEGEESEAVHITGNSGIANQIDYPAPNSHADWVDRDEVDNCWCSTYEDESDWYPDCPKEEPVMYEVIMIHKHYVKAKSHEDAINVIKALDNGFDAPEDTSIVTYDIEPKCTVNLVEE